MYAVPALVIVKFKWQEYKLPTVKEEDSESSFDLGGTQTSEQPNFEETPAGVPQTQATDESFVEENQTQVAPNPIQAESTVLTSKPYLIWSIHSISDH